jgi:hypothetical protein
MIRSSTTQTELNMNATTTKEANMADFQVLPFDFASTEATFVALTEAAKKYLGGGISVNVRKSAAPDFAERLEAKGFKVQ